MQAYQGVVKHLVEWLWNMMGDVKLDARFKCLPPVHGVRLFSDGISDLTQVSGNEHKDICKQLLGCLLGTPSVPLGAVKASRALLDFLYLAQYPSHSDTTLQYLQNPLDEFHKHKDIFLRTGARLGIISLLVHQRSYSYTEFSGGHFNLPKLHSLTHYVMSIKMVGTTDNHNMEATERLHIDLAKDAYRVSSKKEYYAQMALCEKIWAFEVVLQWWHGIVPRPRLHLLRCRPPGPHLSKTLSSPNMNISTVTKLHVATSFRHKLHSFIRVFKANASGSSSWVTELPINITHIDIWHSLKFTIHCIHPGTSIAALETLHTVHAAPERGTHSSTKMLALRFDTVLVVNDVRVNHGIKGVISSIPLHNARLSNCSTGKRVGQIHVIFKIPDRFLHVTFGNCEPPGALAYIEWFTMP